MKLSKYFWQTYKEKPNDAVINSHILMSRAGLILKEAAGLYQYLPMGVRVLKKIQTIIRAEMDRAGSQELSMSVVTPGELWKETGRWNAMGGEMLKFQDKAGRDLCISPTNEEAITDIFRKTIRSYKQLPVNLYQINTKFRDEIRPRFGLMRGREFMMKDAYSFHIDKESLDETYDQMYQAYQRILKKINLQFFIVEADAGSMGSSDSKTHEFHVVANAGEDELIFCQETGYAANIEKAQTKRKPENFNKNILDLELVSTPKKSSIEDVCQFLEIPNFQSLKSLVYTYQINETEKSVLALLLGDDQLNEVKLKNFLGCEQVYPSDESTLSSFGMAAGFIGPLNLKNMTEKSNLKILIDRSVPLDANFVIGSNIEDQHYKNFIPSRDLKNELNNELKNDNEHQNHAELIDLRLAQKGDLTFDGMGTVEIKRGIEAGHIFQLGNKYTDSMGATVLDKNGKALAPLMGCYGMGVSRIAAAAIEQHCDDKGIIWPKAIAPYQVHFILIGKSEQIKAKAEEIYQLLSEHFETLFDDRKVGPGFKFKDADLLGCPIILALGEKGFNADGMLEVTNRQTGEKLKYKTEKLIEGLENIWKEMK